MNQGRTIGGGGKQSEMGEWGPEEKKGKVATPGAHGVTVSIVLEKGWCLMEPGKRKT